MPIASKVCWIILLSHAQVVGSDISFQRIKVNCVSLVSRVKRNLRLRAIYKTLGLNANLNVNYLDFRVINIDIFYFFEIDKIIKKRYH